MKIVIATDGSEFSQYAVEKFCELFGKMETLVIEIVSVFEEIAVTGEPFGVSADFVRDMEKIGHENATKFAADAAQSIRSRMADSAKLTTKILKGSAGRSIVEEAGAIGADLIVVGSHGYGFWSRAFLGSVSQTIIHHAPCSVLVVRMNKKTVSLEQ